MSEQPASPPPSGILNNPQVLVALITGVVTVVAAVVGILPDLIARSAPTPTPTATLTLTPTEIPPTPQPAAHTAAPITPEPSPSPLPALAATAPAAPQTGEANARLFRDEVSFTLLNLSGRTLSLEGVVFASAAGRWEARSWGPSLHDRLPAGQCLRIREMAAGRRSPPAECSALFGLIEVGAPALFWRGDTFEVRRRGALLATCVSSAPTCDVFIPQG